MAARAGMDTTRSPCYREQCKRRTIPCCGNWQISTDTHTDWCTEMQGMERVTSFPVPTLCPLCPHTDTKAYAAYHRWRNFAADDSNWWSILAKECSDVQSCGYIRNGLHYNLNCGETFTFLRYLDCYYSWFTMRNTKTSITVQFLMVIWVYILWESIPQV